MEALYAGEGAATPPTLVSQLGSVGADAGSTLNVTRSISTFDPGGEQDNPSPALVFLGNSIGVQKVGAGIVTVGSEPYVRTRIGGATSSFNGSVLATGSLNVQAGTLRMTSTASPAARSVFDVGSATVNTAAGAKLDLTNNAGVVDYAGASPLTTIQSLIANAYNTGVGSGHWQNPGITSSMANDGQFAVGYGEASAVLGTTAGTDALFLGNVVDDTAVLLRFVRYGDADLNGVVNLIDFNKLAANFNTSGKVWSQGDFNYDGNVNLLDFNKLAANFNLTATGLNGEPTPQDWANLSAAVPEPTSLSLFALAGAGLLKRRRRAKKITMDFLSVSSRMNESRWNVWGRGRFQSELPAETLPGNLPKEDDDASR